MGCLQAAQLVVNRSPVGMTQVFGTKVGTRDNFYKSLETFLGLLHTLVPIPIPNVPQTLIWIGMERI